MSSWWGRCIRRRGYPLLAVLLAQGAPLGLLLLRLTTGRIASPFDVGAELASDPSLYAYLSLATAVVMGTMGAWLGRIQDRLERSSITDELTGLANRRGFEQRLDQELARAARFNEPVSLVMLDLDGFKRVNDLHGHPHGDHVLARVGRLVAATARRGDIACRYGGEEVAVICPGTKGKDALALAERLRKSISCLSEGEPGDWPVGVAVTISAGVAELLPEQDARSRLLARADAALYAAKSEGRNRCILDPAQPPNEEPHRRQ